MSLLSSILLSSLIFLPQGEDQAERLLDQAQTFMNAGKYQEALTDLDTVVNTFGDTPYAAQALIAIGNYYFDVAGDPETAAGYYERVKTSYARTAEAPEAYYQLARIVDRQGNMPADLETAVADLIRMTTLYPDNPWSDGAALLHGKLARRLGQFETALSYFQRLEFNHPNTPGLPAALLWSAETAYLLQSPDQAADVLARLQRKFPNTPESARAAAMLRLLERFSLPGMSLTPDSNFFGATPKRFDNPRRIMVAPDGTVSIIDDEGAHFGKTGPFKDMQTIAGRDLVDLAVSREGQVILVFENRLVPRDGNLPPITTAGGAPREILAASVDNFGRLFVVDGDARVVQVYDRNGGLLQSLRVNRPRLVRTFRDAAYVTDDDGRLLKFDGALASANHPFGNLQEINDFRFDPLGNLYVLRDRGAQLLVFDVHGQQKLNLNLKGGTLPLKQAEGIGVDAAGSIYLSDRRGGAVYRFQ